VNKRTGISSSIRRRNEYNLHQVLFRERGRDIDDVSYRLDRFLLFISTFYESLDHRSPLDARHLKVVLLCFEPRRQRPPQHIASLRRIRRDTEADAVLQDVRLLDHPEELPLLRRLLPHIAARSNSDFMP
jgi:hypothetical protein